MLRAENLGSCNRRWQLDCQLPSHSCSSSLDLPKSACSVFFTSVCIHFTCVFLSSCSFQVFVNGRECPSFTTSGRSLSNYCLCRRSTNALPLGAWSTMPVLAGAAVCLERHLSHNVPQNGCQDLSKQICCTEQHTKNNL